MRFALRQLLKSPGFTAIALLTLALGIGVNSSMFSVLNATLLRDLPYPAVERLVRVFRTAPSSSMLPHSPANFTDYRAQQQSFSHLAAVNWTSFNFAGDDRAAERVPGLSVTADFFGALHLAPALGRTFAAEEDQPGRSGVIVLSDALWRQRFAADPAIIGRELRIDGETVTVIGVMPPQFNDRQLWGRVEAWRPMAFDQKTLETRGANWLGLIGRLRDGVTLEQAQAEATALGTRLAESFPQVNANSNLHLSPLAETGEDPIIRMLSWFTTGLAACVLLIACANLANLQFARNAARTRERAVRAALGASRWQLMRQTLSESLLLAIAGGGLGLLVASWSNQALGSRIDIAGVVGLSIPLNGRVLAFTLGAAVLTGILFGVLPAWLASRADINDALKQNGRGNTNAPAAHRVRHALIVAEFAIALVLLCSATFFLRGLDRFITRDHGWQTAGLLTANVALPSAVYSSPESQRQFHAQLLERLAALPGVQHLALAQSLPFWGFDWTQRFIVEGQPVPASGTEAVRGVNTVTPDYFAAMGIGFVEGRGFNEADREDGRFPTIINEAMARALWPDESAIGKRIAHPVERQWQEIVGVVRDVSFTNNLAEPRTPFQAYRLFAREPSRTFGIVLRCTVAPESLAPAVRAVVAELDADLPVHDLNPAVLVVRRGLVNFAVVGWLLSGFALLGLLLAAIGIYGVIAGHVVQRRSEIGIRMALGAQVQDVLRLVIGQGLRLATIGAAIGLAGAWAVARLLTAIAPKLPGADLLTTVLVTSALLVTAFLACWLPARRAARVDPLTALRAE